MSRAPILTAAQWFDPGWLYVAAGAALLVAVTLLPAQEDLLEAQWRRDQALAWEVHQLKRLERRSAYLESLDRRDPKLIASLAMVHLNLTPTGAAPLSPLEPARVAQSDVGDVVNLDPPPPRTPRPAEPDSLLWRLATSGRWRLWLIAGGAMALLFGLLPPASPRRR